MVYLLLLSQKVHDSTSSMWKIININNIDTLLVNRYLNRIERKVSNHIKGPKKRTKANDEDFRKALINILTQN